MYCRAGHYARKHLATAALSSKLMPCRRQVLQSCFKIARFASGVTCSVRAGSFRGSAGKSLSSRGGSLMMAALRRRRSAISCRGSQAGSPSSAALHDLVRREPRATCRCSAEQHRKPRSSAAARQAMTGGRRGQPSRECVLGRCSARGARTEASAGAYWSSQLKTGASEEKDGGDFSPARTRPIFVL